MKWLLTLLIIVGILFCFPYLASIPPMKQLVLRVVEKKLDAKLKVDRLRLSWFGPQKGMGVQLKTNELEGSFQEIDVNSPLWAIGRSFTISGGRIQVPQNQTSLENIQAVIVGPKINATGTTRAGDEIGKFSIQGTAVSQDEFQLSFAITKMPTAIADWLLKTNGMATLILGSNFNMTGVASHQNNSGKFDFDLSSPTTSASVGARIQPDSILLQKPLTATLKLTPEASLALSGNKVAVTGQDPIILNLSSGGFYLPRPFSLEGLKIGQAKLSLGRLRLQNADYLSGLSIFLKTKRFDTNQVDAWFARADFSLADGVLDLARTDFLLANSVHLCSWGQTDVVKQTLDMILGVPEDTLRKSFGIRSLSSRYVLQIPMTGTYKNPQLDTGSATAKIAAIVAAGKIQNQGGILGGVAGIINQAAQEKSPPPVNPYPPFPWDR